jgi:uncharacterized protein (TIRG00374 family)
LDHLLFLGWIWLPLILLEGLGEAMHAIGWRHCLSVEHKRLGLLTIAMIRQAGMAFNYLTPTAHLGGEVIKGALLGRDGNGAQAAGDVIVGKVALGLAELILIVSGSMVALWMSDLPKQIWLGWAASTAVFSFMIVTFFFLQRQGQLGAVIRTLQRMGVRGRSVSTLAERIAVVDEQLKRFHRDRYLDFLKAMGWHFLGASCGIVQAWIFLMAIGLTHPWEIGLTIWFLGAWFDLIGFIVPAGVGVQEGSRVLIFTALGLAGIKGLTYGMVLRVQKAFWAGVGLACYALLTQKRGQQEAPDAITPVFSEQTRDG